MKIKINDTQIEIKNVKRRLVGLGTVLEGIV